MKQTLIIGIAYISASHLSQAALEVDQAQGTSGFFLHDTLDGSYAQSFTPAQNNVAAISVRLLTGSGPSTQANLTINLWDGFPSVGNLLGQATILATVDGSLEQVVFDQPVSVIPNHTYFFQPITEIPESIQIQPNNSYSNGDFYQNAALFSGLGMTGWDLLFVDYYSPDFVNTRPALTIRLADSNTVVITWPLSASGYALEQNASLISTNWIVNTSAVNVVSGTNQVMVSRSIGNMFFRLKASGSSPTGLRGSDSKLVTAGAQSSSTIVNPK